MCKLKKSLYGLKDSPKLWKKHLEKVLHKMGFKTSDYDSCLFYQEHSDGSLTLICTHVDDLFCVASSDRLAALVKALKETFGEDTKVAQGDEICYLGIILRKVGRYIHLSQPGYVKKISDEFGYTAEDLTLTPYSLEAPTPAQMAPFDDITLYKRRLMMLQHVTKTRVEIKEGVVRCASRQASPTLFDYLEVERMALYIHSTPDAGLTVAPSDMVLHASVDASFAKYADCKSQSGSILWFGEQNAPVHASSNKQTMVSRSSTEAEMIALSTCLEETLLLRWILAEIGLPQPTTSIQQDNQSVIVLENQGAGNGRRGRYINIKYYFVSQFIASKELELVYTHTADLIADGMTKNLCGSKFLEWPARVRNDPSKHRRLQAPSTKPKHPG